MVDNIHSSHSKKELCEIIEIFDINVCNYRNLNKKNLSKSLLYELSKIEEVKEDDAYYFIKDKSELYEYLVNPDSSKILTIKEKNKVMELAKYIIMYVKNDYFLSQSPFLDWDDMFNKCIYIKDYGDIPSVRKAINMFNTDPRMLNRPKIDIIMSSRCRKKLERKKRLVQKQKVLLSIKRGKFIIELS
jgi:hypothetical protein